MWDEQMKWNESGFRPPLCTYRLNWARRTSWGWWDDWDDTVLQTQDSKFEPWRSEAEHATSRSRRLPTILTFTRGWGRNNFVSLKPPRPGTEPRTLAWKAAVLTTTLGPPPREMNRTQESTNQKTTANYDIRKLQCKFTVFNVFNDQLKLDLGSLDRSYDGTIMRANQQSQSSEQPNNRANHLSNWTTESIKWDTTEWTRIEMSCGRMVLPRGWRGGGAWWLCSILFCG